jgi:hypothetical protein
MHLIECPDMNEANRGRNRILFPQAEGLTGDCHDALQECQSEMSGICRAIIP